MTHPRNQSLSENLLEIQKLRKKTMKHQSLVIRSYGHLLDKALDSEDIHAEVQQVRNNLYEFADKLKEMSEEV